MVIKQTRLFKFSVRFSDINSLRCARWETVWEKWGIHTIAWRWRGLKQTLYKYGSKNVFEANGNGCNKEVQSKAERMWRKNSRNTSADGQRNAILIIQNGINRGYDLIARNGYSIVFNERHSIGANSENRNWNRNHESFRKRKADDFEFISRCLNCNLM